MTRFETCVSGKQVGKVVKDLIKKGTITRIKVSSANNKRVFLDVPVNCLAIAGILAPLLSGAGVALALLKSCKIEFFTEDSGVNKQQEVS